MQRSGATWFLAIMNGTTRKQLRVPLSFLKEGTYNALLVRDDPENAAAVRLENSAVKCGDVLTIDWRERGGFIGRFGTADIP